jgi:hypothetical protein
MLLAFFIFSCPSKVTEDTGILGATTDALSVLSLLWEIV